MDGGRFVFVECCTGIGLVVHFTCTPAMLKVLGSTELVQCVIDDLVIRVDRQTDAVHVCVGGLLNHLSGAADFQAVIMEAHAAATAGVITGVTTGGTTASPT